MSSDIIEALGYNGQLELTESVLRIKRKGVMSFITQGLKGDKEILIAHISSIQFKNANALINGYIQFSFLGGKEAKGGLTQAASDENTVLFRKPQQPAFEILRDELQRRMAALKQSANNPPSALDELEKLASLRDRGIVSEEEFQKKKSEILAL